MKTIQLTEEEVKGLAHNIENELRLAHDAMDAWKYDERPEREQRIKFWAARISALDKVRLASL